MLVTPDAEEINMAYDEQEKNLMAALQDLTSALVISPPRLRKDGDIVIPLDAVLKKNRGRIAILRKRLANSCAMTSGQNAVQLG